MAVAHVYVRLRATGSNEHVQAIDRAVQSLRAAVEASGSAWSGTAHLALDDPDDGPPPEPQPQTPHVPPSEPTLGDPSAATPPTESVE